MTMNDKEILVDKTLSFMSDYRGKNKMMDYFRVITRLFI